MYLSPFEKKPSIRIFPDSALRLEAKEITHITDETARLAQFMVEAMMALQGVGLAANQVGILARLIVIAPDDMIPLALINPKIEWEGLESEEEVEGCLSLPYVSISVRRPAEITLTARDLSGEEKWYELSGEAARVVQHEIDHLNGRLIIDHAQSPQILRDAFAKAALIKARVQNTYQKTDTSFT